MLFPAQQAPDGLGQKLIGIIAARLGRLMQLFPQSAVGGLPTQPFQFRPPQPFIKIPARRIGGRTGR